MPTYEQIIEAARNHNQPWGKVAGMLLQIHGDDRRYTSSWFDECQAIRAAIASDLVHAGTPRSVRLRRLVRETASFPKSGGVVILVVPGDAIPHQTGKPGHFVDRAGREYGAGELSTHERQLFKYVHSTRAVTVGAEWAIVHFHAI